jgi:hypothetical protein
MDQPHSGAGKTTAHIVECAASLPRPKKKERHHRWSGQAPAISYIDLCHTDTFGVTIAPNEASPLSRPDAGQLTPQTVPSLIPRSYVYSLPVKHQVRESVNLPVQQPASIVQYGRKLDYMDGNNRGIVAQRLPLNKDAHGVVAA